MQRMIQFYKENNKTNFTGFAFTLGLLVMLQLYFPHLVMAQTDGIPRGAQLPYARYESEDASKGGGAALQQTLNHDYNTIAAEATNQKYVSLPSNGSYVEWTASASFQGVNMRFTMPDNSTGTGNNGSLGLYINGTRIQTINLTSRWAYQYFHGSETEPVQEPGGKTFMEFDEVHFRLANSYPQGTVIRIAKDNGDGFTYGVDFLELEAVPAALGAPANSLSVTDYGANGSDSNDDLAAFYSCLNAAKAQGKNVYVPAGRFLLSDRLDFNYNNLIFQGAGIWHTEIFFSTDLQFTGGFLARASNVDIGNFSLNTQNNDRFHYGETNPKYSNVHGEPYKIYKGFMGTYGTGSRIHDVWVEHFECGFWIAGYDPPYPIDITTDLIITRARIRNNYADGVNFCQGTNNSVVEYSSIRNSGDDGLAMWPNNFQNAPQETNNIFRYNTVENIWRAGGIAIFGGYGHQVFRNIIKDGVGGSAIRFTQDFPGHTFEQGKPKIVLTDNYIVSCGTSYDLWNQMRGAIEFFTPRGIYDLEFNNTQIINLQRHAVNFEGNFNNVNFNSTTIDGTGMDAIVDNPGQNSWGGYGIRANASGNATFTTISYNRLESGEFINHNTGFNLVINPGIVPLTGITLAPTSASIVQGGSASLQVTYSPTNATNKNVTWTTSNASVASVTAAGTGTATVTANAVGTAVITVTSQDGNFSRTCNVSVTPAVTISATDATAGEGGNVGVFRISTGSTSSNITVGYTVSGTATSADYSSSPALSGSVTLTPSAPAVNITITPTDDTSFEGSENLTLTLQPGAGYNLGGSTVATVSIADNENPPCTAPVIGFTNTAPVIDQSIDGAWSTVPPGTLNNVTFGSMPGDFSGSKWRAMYDNTNLYVLVEVKDNNKFNDSGASWWEDDVVEIFIDGDNSKGTSYDGQNDFQLGFRYTDTNINVGGNSVNRTTGIVFAIQNITGGYNLEARIPWSTIGVTAVTGNRIGFDVSVDDDDNGGARDSQVSAFATTSMGWSNPSLFGSVYLTTCGVNVPVTGVAVLPTSATINVGGTQQLTATISPSNATNQNVSWSSNNTSVATVNASGLVTGVATGSATITVTTQDGNRTATSAITVNTTNIPVTGVTVSPTSATINAGGTQQLTATVAPANATNKNVSWSTSNASVATVNSTGLVSGVAAGSATITVTTQDGNKTATSAITVTSSPQTPYPGPSAHSIPGTIEVENFDNGGEGIAFHDSDAINSGGQGRTTLGVDTENCSEGGLNVGWTNKGEWLEYTVNVTVAGTYTIDVRAASIFSGGTFHIEFGGVDKTGLMTTTNTNAWQTWTTITKTGVSLSAGTQVMRIYMDNANFNLNSVTISNGNIPVTGVTVSPTSATISPGETQQLTATVAPANATNKNVSWSSSNTAVATVNSSGLVTGVANGTATITVTTQDGNKTATSAITVSSTDPAGIITCFMAPGTMTINGQLTETGWNVTRAVSKAVIGTPNNTVTYGVMWDNSNLYIGAKVLDANLFSDSPNTWEDDGVEIYIDANNNKLTTYDGADNQIIKNYNKSSVVTKFTLSGLQHGWAAITGGYSIEVAVPWSSLGISPSGSTQIGFDIGYNDDDNGGNREHQAMWNGTVNNWQNTSAFGSLVLNAGTSGAGGRQSTHANAVADPEEAMEQATVSVSVTPNPVKNGKVRISIPEHDRPVPLQIMNITGRVIYKNVVDGNEEVVDFSGESNGLYLIKVIVDDKLIIRKVVLE